MEENEGIDEIKGKRELAFEFENGCKLWVVKQSNIIIECKEQEIELDIGKPGIGLLSKLLDL